MSVKEATEEEFIHLLEQYSAGELSLFEYLVARHAMIKAIIGRAKETS